MNDLRPHYTSPVSSICAEDCTELITLALAEDAPGGDPSSEAIFSAHQSGEARIVAQENGIICGLSLLPFLFAVEEEQSGARIEYKSQYRDGQKITEGDSVASLKGSLRVLLRLERVILNFLQYLSGISSQTAKIIEAAGPDIIILDTRKTLPGFRRLAKYAVYCGGGTNHRIHLSDMAMIKDNHIAAVGSIEKAVKAVRQKKPHLRLEVEIDSLEQLEEALGLDVDVILLDNMNIGDIHAAKEILKRSGYGPQVKPRPFLEFSGNWTPERLQELKGLGLGQIGLSMGALTHRTRFLDLSMTL